MRVGRSCPLPAKVKSLPSLASLLRNKDFFGSQFNRQSWASWHIFVKALFGLPLTPSELPTFQQCTGRIDAPKHPAREGWVIAGRRGGKSIIAALVAVYLACFKTYCNVLAPGEKGTVLILAADRLQARVVFRFVVGLLESVPVLADMVVNKTTDAVELSNSVILEIHASSYRNVRGYAVIACICDELAFWRSDESANPDSEILSAVRPGMASVPGALLLCISSPYAKRGELWKTYKGYFGRENNEGILVWNAPTNVMNPLVDQKIIDAAYAQDEAAAASEYGAQFRRDLEGFVSADVIAAAMVPGRFELPFLPGINYLAFCDPSGGSQDSMTLAIAHNDDGRAILDVVREIVPPFSPDQVTKDFASLLKAYKINAVQGDRYAGAWCTERFGIHGINYELADKTKSEIYLAALPALNSGRFELLDNKRLSNQLLNLERRTNRGGRDSVDHSSGLHDDLANAACGALVMALAGTALDTKNIITVDRRLDFSDSPWGGIDHGKPNW